MHRLLERQLRRHQLDPAQLSPQILAMLADVSNAYEKSDDDRALTMRSLELISQEHVAHSGQLKERNAELTAAQNHARQMAEQLQLALDGASLGIWSWDVLTSEMRFSPQACDICGFAHQPLHRLDDILTNLYRPDQQRIRDAIDKAISTRNLAQLVRVQHPSGDIRWLRFLGRMETDGCRMHGIVRDVTDEAQSTQLRDSLAAIVASANVAIASTTFDGRVLTWNDGAARLFNLQPWVVLGQPVRTLFSPDQAARIAENFAVAIAGKNPPPLETSFRRQDGETIYIILNFSPLRDLYGDVDGVSIVVQDITTRTRAERMEAERNALAAAVTKLEDALAVVAHELRTPLAGIRATVELLLERAAAARSDNHLRTILDTVVHTSRVVNDLLEITRLNSGCANWRWEQFELGAAMDSAISCLGMGARNGAVCFHAIVDPPELTMYGDGDAISRLILNFTNNALKATTHGFVRAEITPHTDDAGGRFVHIVISDTGKGMTPEVLQRLGEPFALNSGLIGESFTSGTGLGVAICKGIIEAHGGHVQFNSTPDRGTTVDILLKADLPAPVLIGARAQKSSPASSDHQEIVI